MKQSQLFTKTQKTISGEEASVNAQFLTRGGFVYKNSAGVYSYLPLGLRVIEKISTIIREEMAAIGGVELLLPALVDRKYLEATKRFDLAVGFDVLGKGDADAKFSLGWTHEEVLTAIAVQYINSYKDLPKSLYQIQTKFRNEPRAKSGLLRGREFLMKDLYSFHTSEKDLFEYYGKVKEAYFKVFARCGLDPLYTLAAGGDFTMNNTHEFQVLSDVGEDTVFYCKECHYAENDEVSKLKDGAQCPKCNGKISAERAIEVGNIFPLGTKYSEALKLSFKDKEGEKKPVVMGSYGIGISRLMGAIIETHHDETGIIWPREVAPFDAHLVRLGFEENVENGADELYGLLSSRGRSLMPTADLPGSAERRQKKDIAVLYDDRKDVSSGEKLADADLLGIPVRIVVSKKTMEKGVVEVKERNQEEVELVKIEEVIDFLDAKFQNLNVK